MEEMTTKIVNEPLPDQSEMIYYMPLLESYAEWFNVIVELGCGHGNGSTRAFLRGLARNPNPNKILVSVDIDPERPQERPTVGYWRKVTGDSQKTLVALDVFGLVPATLLLGAVLIFVDTVHTAEQMEQELNLWGRLFGDGSTEWIFHDTHMFGVYNHMTDAIKEYAAAHGLVYKDLDTESHGMGWMGRAEREPR